MTEEALPLVLPAEAIAYFRAKGWEIAFDWRDVWQAEHARAFTVAKAMSRDLLEDIRAAVDTALAEGQTLETFKAGLKPKLEARGWWGRKWMTDPQTGEKRVVQLGSPGRLRTIYQTNLRTAYMAGKWQRIERSARAFPFLRYVSVMDGRERPEHHAWHGTLLPVGHVWWLTHYGPCGWGCRCDVQQLNLRMMARRGWEVTEPVRFPERDHVNRRTGEVTRTEQGIDPGWSYNVGLAPLDALTPSPRGFKAGEEEALSAFSEGDFSRVKNFFAAFGLDDLDAATRGTVWRDAAGWPMAISLGLLRGPDGRMVRLPRPAQPQSGLRQLARAARVLRDPETISLIWVTGKNGRAMLVRRYMSQAGTVDVGREFWRWRSASARHAPVDRLVWRKG